MSASPYGRICMTSGRKTANRLTWAVPGTHGHESGRVAREGWRRAGCPARLGSQPGRGGLMLEVRRDHRCCDRFAATNTEARTSRRRPLRDAVFGPQDAPADDAAADDPERGELPRAVTGTVRDVSPHVLVIGNGADDTRITLTADATAWRGGPLDPAAVQPGDHAVVRLHSSQRGVADRILANIRRVPGTLTGRAADTVRVAGARTKHRR